MEKKLKVSIITVCFNSENTIESTLESVLNQNYRPLEYIVIDGKSTDRTIDIIKKYENIMKEKGIDFKYISENDSGIYNAMNKGTRMASGDWIAFMNSDDRYIADNVISEAFEYWDEQSSVIFGNEVITNGRNQWSNKRNGNMNQIKKCLPFCHQASFIKTDLMKKYEYDETYSIVADYNFFLSLYFRGEKFQYINKDIALYYDNGESAFNYKQSINELYSVKIAWGIWKKNIYFWLKKEMWIFFIGMKAKYKNKRYREGKK